MILKKIIALFTTAALVLTMFSGCGNSADSLDVTPNSVTSEPTKGNSNTLRIGTIYENTPFNTATSDGAFGRLNYNSFVRLNFWRFNEQGTLTGDGCFFKNWEVIDDNSSLVLNFDPLGELYWHDGKPVTIEDVLFTFDFYKKNNHTWFMKIKEVTSMSDTSIKVTFEDKSAFSFMHQVTLMYAIMPKHIWENIDDPKTLTDASAAVGCGPFRFVSNDPAAQISYYEAVKDYPIGDITIDKIELKSYDSQATLAMAIADDEIDVMYGYSASLDPTLLSIIDNEEALNRGESQNSATYQLIFGFNKSPTDNKDFRMAVRYALDYSLLNNYLTGGYGTIAKQGAVSPSALGYDDALPLNEQDIERSKKILDDANFRDIDGDGMRELPSGEMMNVMLGLQGSNETYKRLAEILQTNLAAVGIRVTVDDETISNPDHMIKLRTDGSYELYLGMTTVGIASWTGIASYIAAITMTSSQRFGTYNDPAYLAAYDSMMGATTYDEYTSAFQKIQQMNMNECPGIALAIMQTFYPYRTDRITGWMNYPAWGVIHGNTWYSLDLS